MARRDFDLSSLFNTTPDGGIAVGEDPLHALYQRGMALEGVEDQRHQAAQGFLTGQMQRNQAGYEASEKGLAGLFQSRAGDQLNASLTDTLRGLGQSLGGRGIDPNSGAAQGSLERIAGNYQNALTGARRDIALGAYDRAAAQRSAQAAYAQTLTSLMNESPSMIGVDTLSNLAELDLTRYGIDRSAEAAHESARAQERAGRMQGIGSIIGSVLGAI